MRSTDENGHEGHQEKITEKIAGPTKKEPIELSEDKVLNTKFTLSVQTIVGIITVIASAVGMYYMLLDEIQEAKELPSLESLYTKEYPSRPAGYNWPRSYEQYKDQVGTLQDDMDDVMDRLKVTEDKIQELRIEVAKKRNK